MLGVCGVLTEIEAIENIRVGSMLMRLLSKLSNYFYAILSLLPVRSRLG